eukprot:3429903-Pyramimonas_sp.AAC.1
MRYPLVRAQSLVDDCLPQAVGTQRLVAQQLPLAARELFEGLEKRRLRINWGKTGWLATDASLAKELDAQWAVLGLQRHSGLRCLG